jgi:D-alanine-D-alanine ligase-like ATP-grasp enzyme
VPNTDDLEDKLDVMASCMMRAAHARGLPTSIVEIRNDPPDRHNGFWLSFTVGGQDFFYSRGALMERGTDPWGRFGRNVNHEATLLVADKYRTKKFLEQHEFSVPAGLFFRRRQMEDAVRAFDAFTGPICVKPNNGSEGVCVFPALRERSWYEHALKRVTARFPNVLVEESVEGAHFRFFYVQPRVVGIRQGIPANVIGDGISSISALIAQKGAERAQRSLPMQAPLRVDDEIREFLARTNRSLDDVPANLEQVFLLGISNGNAGADTILLWDEVHPSYRDVVAQACNTVPGLLFSGVDIIIKDVTQPAAPDNHWLIEMNASPAITPFYFPWEGETVDIAGLILDMLKAHYAPQIS